jgi:peptidoglycan-associated lipoprotein
MFKNSKKLLVLALFTSLMAACSSTKEPVEEDASSEPAVVASQPVKAEHVVSNHNSVFFAFNKYDVNQDYNGLVAANAKFLASNATAKVIVSGNTDDVGSVEYNLALGQKRSNAVKKALLAAGAKSSQIEATSNGKLKAKFANDNDQNRSLNRRADIVYKGDAPKGYSVENDLPKVNVEFYGSDLPQGIQ